jgi:hypothetical protein
MMLDRSAGPPSCHHSWPLAQSLESSEPRVIIVAFKVRLCTP